MNRPLSQLAAASIVALSAGWAMAQTSPVPSGPQNTPDNTPRQIDIPSGSQNTPAPAIQPDAAESADALPSVEPLGAIPPVIEVIDPTVFAVRIVGPWTDKDVQGFSRVILVAEGDTPRLYVQWMEQPADDEPSVRATVEVEQVATDKLVFGDIRVEASRNDASVFLDTRVDVQGFRETYVLNVGGPGQIQFGPATN